MYIERGNLIFKSYEECDHQFKFEDCDALWKNFHLQPFHIKIPDIDITICISNIIKIDDSALLYLCHTHLISKDKLLRERQGNITLITVDIRKDDVFIISVLLRNYPTYIYIWRFRFSKLLKNFVFVDYSESDSFVDSSVMRSVFNLRYYAV